MSEPKPRITRWMIPVAIIWSTLLMSAWVYSTQLGDKAPKDPELLALILLAAPAVGLLLLLTVLFSAKRVAGGSDAGETTDLVVIWMLTFLFILHAATLAVLIGVLDSLVQPAAGATALLFFGLGFLLRGLEHRSPVGVRTQSTLADPEAWGRAHRAVSMGLWAAGLVAAAGTALNAPIWVAGSVGVSALALIAGAIAGRAKAVNAGAPVPVEEKKVTSNEDAP